MILDENDNEITYWAVGGLDAGEDSSVITIGAYAFAGAKLRATVDPDARVMGRIAGGGAYQDLAQSPIDLTSYGTVLVRFEIYLHANSPIVGFKRVGLNLVVSSGTPAAWLG